MNNRQDYESFVRKVIVEGDFEEFHVVGVSKPTIHVNRSLKGYEEGYLYFPHKGILFRGNEIPALYDSLNLGERMAIGRIMDRMVASGEADELIKLRYL